MNKKDSAYEARKQYYDEKVEEGLDAIDSFEKSKKKRKQKLFHIDEKIENLLDPRKTKMTLEFNNRESASIQIFAVTKRHTVKVTTRFMFGKSLMFAELSLKSFIYELVG